MSKKKISEVYIGYAVCLVILIAIQMGGVGTFRNKMMEEIENIKTKQAWIQSWIMNHETRYVHTPFIPEKRNR